MRRMQNIALALSLTVALMLGMVWSFGATPAIAQNIACYMTQGGAKWVGASGCEWELRSGATLDVQAGVDTAFGGLVELTPSDSIAVTDGGYVTPTSSFQPLTSSGNVGTSGAYIAVLPAGTVLVLANLGSNTITFTETGTLVSAGNIALGANDSATLISNGTNWYQIGASNN